MSGLAEAATELDFTERTRTAVGSQVVGRLLIQTGRPLGRCGRAAADGGVIPRRQPAAGGATRLPRPDGTRRNAVEPVSPD